MTWLDINQAVTWDSYKIPLLQAHFELAQKSLCSGLGEQYPDYHAFGVPMGRHIDDERLVFNSVVPINRVKRNGIDKALGPRLIATVEQLRNSS